MLPTPPVKLLPAELPTAVLSVPVVLSNSAAVPTAVLLLPVLRTSVPAPTPVLKFESPAEKREYQSTPVFPAPVPRCWRALHPSAVGNSDSTRPAAG